MRAPAHASTARTGPAWTTIAAGALAIVVTLPFLDRAITNIALLRNGLVPPAAEEGAALLGVPPSAYGTVMAFSTTLLTFASVWTLLVSLGVLARRPWAREAALFTFVLYAMTLPISFAGMLATPPAPNARVGVVAGLVDLAVAALLASRATADDVERAANERRSRRPKVAGSGGSGRR